MPFSKIYKLKKFFIILLVFLFGKEVCSGGVFSTLFPEAETASRESQSLSNQRNPRIHERFERIPEYFESKGGQFYYDVREAPDYPRTGVDGPRAYRRTRLGVSIEGGLYDKRKMWPIVHNSSIFPYLINYGRTKENPEFCDFIRGNYKSSCAIVYYTPEGDFPIILGSGGLIKDYQTVATARHVVEDLDLSQLYVRFYDYEVTASTHYTNLLHIAENYIDVRVTSQSPGKGGLDICLLKLAQLSEDLTRRYMVPLRIAEKPPFGLGTLPSGKYALFHFAGGKHLISVGKIEAPETGAWLHSNIGIEAGSGASGAIPIRKSGSNTHGYGVSIYRSKVADGWAVQPERRIIPFWNFNTGIEDFDKLTTPYRARGTPTILTSQQFDEEGYEYLYYVRIIQSLPPYTNFARNSPGGCLGAYYGVGDNHSNHHIIPRPDMLFLWDYIFQDDNGHETKEGYQDFRPLIVDLCPHELDRSHQPRRTQDGMYRKHVSKAHFAWAWWNLFKGWNEEFRKDDPKYGNGINDFSEKTKPLNFNLNLWGALKELYPTIQALKKVPKSQVRPYESRLHKILIHIRDLWAFDDRGRFKMRYIYDFNEYDWGEAGYRTHRTYGTHKVYQLKSP